MAQQTRASGKSVKLFITYVKGEGKYLKFWAVPDQSRKILDGIERFLEEKSAKFETLSNYLRSSQLQCGTNICVKSETKARWCRARVESNPTQYSVTVKLLDYGQEETVSVSNIRAFDERLFTEQPPVAVECILGDVVPLNNPDWPLKAVKFCEQHMLEQTMCGFVITELNKIPVVRLAKLGQNEPFVQLLINQGLANVEQYEQPRPVTFPKGAGCSPYHSVALGVNTPHLVKISYVDSPKRFFVQLSAAELELNNLMGAIEKHVNSERLAPLESHSINTPCLSPFTYAGSGRRYFRTLITAVESGTCKVFLVDYGYTETKEYSELKALPLNFLHLPIQAFKCSLPDGLNVTKEALVSATSGKHLHCHVLNFNGNSYVVKLSFNNSDLFAVSDPGFSFYNIMHLNIHSREEVLISYVCSSCEFFCQLERNYMLIKNIQSQLNVDNVLPSAKFGDCIPGAPVCVKYSEDSVWYRAKVLHAENPDSIKVAFVDYGNSETTALCNIRRLTPEVAKVPMQALKCTLSGLENVTDPGNSTEVLEELTEDKKLTIEILSTSRETGYVVNLYDTSDANSALNSIIKQRILGVQQQHNTTRMKPAIPDVQSSRPKLQQSASETSVPPPSINRVEKLYISSFTSANLFFGQLNKIDETKLDEMQSEINELYSAAGRSKFTPSVGDVVCAKFSEDENFYRARVEECAGDSCQVLFIDYGNRETVSLGDVHKIRQSFTVLPQFGVECCLQSSPSADSVQQLKDIMEENVYEFNMLSEKNGKWIVSLTEDFVSNALVLELLRQNEEPVRYKNQGPRSTEDSETEAWGESSDMNDRRQYRGDGGVRRDSSRSYSNSDRQKHFPDKQEYFSERQRNIPSRNFGDNTDGTYRNYGERTGGSTRNFGDRTSGGVKNFGGRADGPKKNYGDRSDGPVQNFGGRADGLKKNFGDRTDGPKKNFGDRTDGTVPNFGGRSDNSKKSFGDRNDGPPKNFGDRTYIPKKGFTDSSNNPSRNIENSSWDDTSQRFSPKNAYNDDFSTKDSSFQVTETSRTLTQDSVESPKLTDYTKVIINNGTYLEVYVSHIVNPGEFYCQATEEKSKMPAMMEKISCKYAAMDDNEQRLTDASVGQPCCAIYSEDGCWYRGKVIGTDNPSRPSAYDIFFVDYGNVERVPSSKVKCLDPEFFSWPPQALKCALFNIVPQGGSWSRDDIKTFMNMALDRCFVAKFEQVDSTGTHLVNLLNINKLQDDIINKDLTIAGHGRLADANKLLGINSQVASTNLSFAEPDIQDGTTEEVIVTWVVSPMEFYCQLQSFQSVFMKMMKDLQTYYNNTTDIDHVVDRPQPGMICVAQFSEDNAWYRAKVVSVEKNYVDVYYVDYGNSEQVPKKKVKYIHQDFTVHAVQGIRCWLGGVKLPGESSISKSVGEKYFGGETVCTFVKKADGFFYVTLLNDSKNVAQEMLCGDVVLPDPQSAHLSTSTVDVPALNASTVDVPAVSASTVSVPAVSSSVNCCIPENQLDMSPGMLLSVSVPFIESPKQFWCNLLDNADQLEDLMYLIDARYSSSDTKPLVNINTGCGCVAQYSEDQRWYRAIVKNFQSEMDKCEVFFVDYGNTDVVTASEVKMIEQEFCALPAQAIECRLHSIPDTISSEETTEFMKILESEELLAKVEFVDGDVLVVTLLDSSGEDEINVGESIFCPLPEHVDGETEEHLNAETEEHLDAETEEYLDAETEEHLDVGTEEHLDVGTEEHLDVGTEEHLDVGTEEHLDVGTEEHLDVGTEEHLDVGTEEHLDVETEEHLDLETEVPGFSKPTIRIGMHNGYISCVNDPSDFYVQLEEIEEELSDYASDLSEQYECIPENDFVIQDARVGVACCAKFTDDNQWYRAEIIDITDSSATVLFVDYGNTDVVQVHSLKKLTGDLLKKPPYAIHCALAAVRPVTGNTWSAEAITVFEQSTSDTLLTIKIESQELPVPVVLIKEEEDVAKQLADLQLCHYDNTEVQKTVSTSESVSHHLDTHDNSDIAMDFKPANYAERVRDVRSTVKLSYVYSPDKFFVTPIDLLEQLESIMQKLKELYNPDEELDIPFFVAVEQPCVAKYNEDMAWYRAMITNIQGDEITVLFVDFGNSEVTTASCLRPLTSELLEVPPIAVECCLFGVKSVPENQDKIIEKLEQFVKNEVEFEMDVVEGHHPYKVKLKGERDLVEELVDEGLAEYVHVEPELVGCDQSDESLEVSSPAVILEKEQGPIKTALQDTVTGTAESDQSLVHILPADEQTPIQISVHDISIGKLVVDVKHVEVSNNLIILHVVPSDQNDALADFQNRLNEIYGHSEKNFSCSPSTKYCVVKSSEDDCWYRAEVLHADGGSYYVKYIDFGNCESVPSKNVAKLLPEFSDAQQFSVSCCMFGIRVVEGSEDDVTTRIFDIIGKNCCTLQINCNLPGAFGMCWGLLADSCDSSVLQILVEEGLVCHLCPPVQLPSDEFDAEINSVETDNDLLLCAIPKLWIKEREHLRNALQEACNKTVEAPFDINSNLLCAVLFHDEWNRGYAISSGQEEVVVYLIDFGFTRTVSPCSLKPLPSEFCQTAPLVLRCALHNWIFPLTDTIRDKFYETCIAKMAKCKVRDNLSDFEPFYISISIEGNDVLSCMMEFSEEETSVAQFTTGLQEFEEPDRSQEVNSEYSSLDNFKEPVAENFEAANNSGYPNEDEHFDDAQTQIEFDASVDSIGQQRQPDVTFTDSVEEHGVQKYPERSVSNKCVVKLSFVYSSDKFYVTPVELQEQLDHITSVLKEQYDLTCESDEQPLSAPHLMQPCVAQYADDMTWYRAVITDIKGDEATVMFIDYGNVESVECNGLRVVTPELLKIAPIAVECSLFGIQVIPGKQEDVNSRLMSMSESKVELEMEVIESHESPYKIKLKGDVDISEQFVKEELCEFYVTPSQKLQNSETFKENLRIAFLEEPLSLEENKGIIPQQSIALGSLSASVKYVEVSNGVIVLHIVPDSLKDALTNLQEKLQAVYCNSTCSSLQTGSKFCAAKSPDDGSWYRAQLLEETENGYNVKFIDCGNCEIVPFSDLRVLLPEFVNEVQCSFACYLSGVAIIPGKEEAIKAKIYDLVFETETTIEIYDVRLSTSGMCRAALKVDIDSNDMSHILTEDGLVLQVYPTPCLPGASFQAHVEETRSGEQLLFYVIPTEWIEARNACHKALCETYESAESLTSCSIYNNCLYAAMFDKQWYRASIVSVNADSVLVNLVDYGKHKSVSKELLQDLESEFCHKPPFVLQCTLSGWTTPVSDVVCEKFAAVCYGETVSCKFVEPSSHEPFSVSIEVDGEDILPSLIKLVEKENISERELTSIASLCVDEDTVYEYDPDCDSKENVGDSGKDENSSFDSEKVLHKSRRNSDSSDNFEGEPDDVEYVSAGAGDSEEDETVLSSGVNQFVTTENDGTEIDCLHVSPQKDFTKSQDVEGVNSMVGSPQFHQASELEASLCDETRTANTQPKDVENSTEGTPTTIVSTEDNLCCASTFNESASSAVELTKHELDEDSSICTGLVKEKNPCDDRLFQNSPVVQTAGSSKEGVNNFTSSSVFTESSPSLQESAQKKSVDNSSFIQTEHVKSSGSMQLNQSEVNSVVPVTTDCKRVEEEHSSTINSCEELCTSSAATFLSGSESDGCSCNVSSHSNVENVPKMQVTNSENTDSMCAKVVSLGSDSNSLCEEETE